MKRKEEDDEKFLIYQQAVQQRIVRIALASRLRPIMTGCADPGLTLSWRDGEAIGDSDPARC